MRIIVTGASGFIGGHLCRALHAAGREVLGIARSPLQGFPAQQVAEYGQTPRGDVLIHLAETADRNAVLAAGDANAKQSVASIEGLLKGDSARFLYVSTAAVYSDEAIGARRIGDATVDRDAYVRAKLACELCVASAGGISVRLSNVYGRGMSGVNVVSTILAQIPGNGPLLVRDGGPVRDFLWVDDAVTGLIALVDRATTGLYNLGSGRGIAIRQVARTALQAAGEGQRPVEETQPSDSVSHLVLDVAATVEETGWRPQVTLEAGVARLVHDRLAIGQEEIR